MSTDEIKSAMEGTATLQVLGMPTLLSMIIRDACIEGDECWWNHDHATVQSCLLINHLWFYETARISWEIPMYGQSHLSKRFQQIEPHRRQLYANFVKDASLTPRGGHAYDNYINNVQFPLLDKLTIYFEDVTKLPELPGHRLRELWIDPHFEYNPETYFTSKAGWHELLENVVRLFPHVEIIDVRDRGRVDVGTIARISAQLPRLKEFRGHLEETTEEQDQTWDSPEARQRVFRGRTRRENASVMRSLATMVRLLETMTGNETQTRDTRPSWDWLADELEEQDVVEELEEQAEDDASRDAPIDLENVVSNLNGQLTC